MEYSAAIKNNFVRLLKQKNIYNVKKQATKQYGEYIIFVKKNENTCMEKLLGHTLKY